jgi:hypothetical protein
MEMITLAVILVVVIALACAIAGFIVINLGYKLSDQEKQIRTTIETSLTQTNTVVEEAKNVVKQKPTEGGAGYNVQMQSASSAFSGAAEYVKGLAELAKSLSGLTPAVAAFLIATILFLFAAILATVPLFALA